MKISHIMVKCSKKDAIGLMRRRFPGLKVRTVEEVPTICDEVQWIRPKHCVNPVAYYNDGELEIDVQEVDTKRYINFSLIS